MYDGRFAKDSSFCCHHIAFDFAFNRHLIGADVTANLASLANKDLYFFFRRGFDIPKDFTVNACTTRED